MKRAIADIKKIIDEVEAEDSAYTIERDGKPVAVVISARRYEALKDAYAAISEAGDLLAEEVKGSPPTDAKPSVRPRAYGSMLGSMWSLVREIDNKTEATGFESKKAAEDWAREHGYPLTSDRRED